MNENDTEFLSRIIRDRDKRIEELEQQQLEDRAAMRWLEESYTFQAICNGIYPLAKHDDYGTYQAAIERALKESE